MRAKEGSNLHKELLRQNRSIGRLSQKFASFSHASRMHPATVANVEILRQRRANFIGQEKGVLACEYEGIARLWPSDVIVAKALEYKKR